MTVISLIGALQLFIGSSSFPREIKNELSMNTSPHCSVCHAGGHTGYGTATTLFAEAMKDRGLVAKDKNSLIDSLALMQADLVDSDGDGITDIEALKSDMNPNGEGDLLAPSYGCQATSTSYGGLLVISFFGFLLLTRQRNNKPKKQKV